MQSVRQREQILRLILENENVSLPRTFGSQSVSQSVSQPVSPPAFQPTSPLITLYRLTHLLTLSALPRKQKASQEVTSERCVGTLHCCACATLCTCRATGSSWTQSVCVAVHTAGTCFQRWSCSSPVCLSVCLSGQHKNQCVPSIAQTFRNPSQS